MTTQTPVNPVSQEEAFMSSSSESMRPSVSVKRQVTIKTKVTDTFRTRAKQELDQELKLIDTQLQQLEAQYQYSLQQLEKLAQQGQNVQGQLQQLNEEAQQKRSQLASLKMQLSSELGNLDQVQNGTYLVTGMVESMVNIALGDNLYEKMQNSEILIEDGIVTKIPL
jgi:chromosome segregation ATPase